MLCRRRQCSFRSYEREDCPYAPTIPRIYEQEREAWREGAEKWRTDWQKRNPLLKHFHIKEPAIDFDALKITRRLMAEVTDTTDAVIVEAIRKEAERQGFTDLYLIDRELVKNVITGATPRRGRWRRWAGGLVACTCCNYEYTDKLECADYCGNCGAKMDGEEERKQ
jgi:hypothetical protein